MKIDKIKLDTQDIELHTITPVEIKASWPIETIITNVMQKQIEELQKQIYNLTEKIKILENPKSDWRHD